MKHPVALIAFLLFVVQPIFSAERIPIHIKKHAVGAPLTLGIPVPEAVLYSPDHVRVLDENGEEIVSQVTEVSTWEPADESINWIWDCPNRSGIGPRSPRECGMRESLPMYYRLTGDRKVRSALVRNACRIRDLPPRAHALGVLSG